MSKAVMQSKTLVDAVREAVFISVGYRRRFQQTHYEATRAAERLQEWIDARYVRRYELEAMQIVFWDAIHDMDALGDMWEKAATDNADRKYGWDLVQASDAARVCSDRVREIATDARERLKEAMDE